MISVAQGPEIKVLISPVCYFPSCFLVVLTSLLSLHTCSTSPSLAFPCFHLCFSASLHLHLFPCLVLPVCKPVCSTLSLSDRPVCYT